MLIVISCILNMKDISLKIFNIKEDYLVYKNEMLRY